ncbi:MAG: ABC transporter permease [Acidobacteria bacterium]|nr:ABC transporter permease [Acidobacteriota bacterium]MBW4043955.1 ABC transporter permease [Acidobacteriota bacterium]
MEALLTNLLSDLRYSTRQLIKTPAFTLTALITLALGIGVNAAMFSVIDQVLLRPLPYERADRIVEVGGQSQTGRSLDAVSWPDVRDWRARSHAFQQIGFYAIQFETMGEKDSAKLVPEPLVSVNFFDIFGVQPMLGRGFTADDIKPGRSNVIVLGYSVWKSAYHGDPNIVGQTVKINGDPHQVIGVMPQSFVFPADIGDESFAPLPLDDAEMQKRDNAGLEVVGLLRPGVSIEQARNEINSIHRQLLHEYPKDESKDPLKVETYRDFATDRFRPALYALSFAVVAVWLIACANVAGLMLTRASSRRREIAIRGALGAPRGRLLQQFLTESMLLAMGGGAIGLVLAVGALRVLKHYLAHQVFYGDHVQINVPVLLFLLFVSCLSALLFGLIPGWEAANLPAQEGLRDGSASAGTGKGQARLRDAFVIGEVALTLALLIAAGLMMQTLFRLRHTSLGFVPEHVVTGSIYLPTHGVWFTQKVNENGPTIMQALYQPMVDKLRNTPGIESAGLTTVRPMMPNWSFSAGIVVKGRPKPDHGDEMNAAVRAADAGYFKTFGVRLLRGRMFDGEDTVSSPVSLIVNQALVKKVFPNEEPLGKQIQISDSGPREWATIVGVAEDVHQQTAGAAPLPEVDINLNQLTPKDDMYVIVTSFLMNVGVRTRLPDAVAEAAIRNAVHQLEPDAAIDNLESMQQVIDDSLGSQTLTARLLGLFGFAALLIAAAGIYGLLAYSVSQRTRELGLRLALGAQRGDVQWLVMRHALWLLGTGAAFGIGVALLGSRAMRAFLYGFHGFDVFTIAAVVAVLGLCGLLASYIPARRASLIDPMEALRSE